MIDLIHTLNGRQYLLVEVPHAKSIEKTNDALMKKYNCIYVGIKEVVRGGVFTNSYSILKWLVPAANITEFNKEINNL